MKFCWQPITVAIILVVLLAVMLSGCVQQKFVSERYPRWGDETIIERPGDHLPLILRTLSPPQPVQAPACILLVHGMNEHIGRYQKIARHFSRRYIVAGFDFYAHGLSNEVLYQADQAIRAGAQQGDVSDAYLAQIPLYDLEPLRQDLALVLERFVALCDEQSIAKRPVFIVSHSLGSLVAASYLLQIGNSAGPARRIQGIVLLAPGFAVSEPPGWRGWLQNPIIRLSFYAEEHFLYPQDEPWPKIIFNQLLSLAVVPLFDGLFEVLSWPGLRALFTPTQPTWVADYLTDDEAEKARLRADNWIVRRSLLRYVKGIEGEIVNFRRHMDQFTKPYLLIASALDPITPAWGNADFVQVTCHNHPGNRFLLLNNLQYHQHLFLRQSLQHKILAVIEQWLDQRIHDALRMKKSEICNNIRPPSEPVSNDKS